MVKFRISFIHSFNTIGGHVKKTKLGKNSFDCFHDLMDYD